MDFFSFELWFSYLINPLFQFFFSFLSFFKSLFLRFTPCCSVASVYSQFVFQFQFFYFSNGPILIFFSQFKLSNFIFFQLQKKSLKPKTSVPEGLLRGYEMLFNAEFFATFTIFITNPHFVLNSKIFQFQLFNYNFSTTIFFPISQNNFSSYLLYFIILINNIL